jgi:hypothetical protein
MGAGREYQSDACREQRHVGVGAATELEMLVPRSGGPAATSIVLALPVEDCGTSTKEYGSAIGLIRSSGWLAAHPAVAIATPAFSTTPWFGDNPASSGGPRVRQESYLTEVICPYLLGGAHGLPIARNATVSLLGFSKSGWGSFSLLLRNEKTFARAALWDAPTMLGADYCAWLRDHDKGKPQDLWGMMEVFGDCETWRKYSPIEIVERGGRDVVQRFAAASAGAGDAPRIWLGGQHYFGPMCASSSDGTQPGFPFNHTVDFHAALTARSIAHAYDDSLDPGRHEWSWLWMQPALEFLLAPPRGAREGGEEDLE